ncbi:hypothetical protein [Panacagrimonas sp.]|uniref:hypothetical protein n=1 Tax=Panacagrimonas sp. TaxID=2480088 RepID=UPI003B52ED25
MILLDTHARVWADTDIKKLGRKSRALIERGSSQGGVAISALSFWEATLLHERGRIALQLPPTQ